MTYITNRYQIRSTLYSGLCLVAMLLCDLALQGCITDPQPEERPTEEAATVSGGAYISVGLSLRAQNDDEYSINKDKDDYEDAVSELRLFVFQGDKLIHNYYYSKSNTRETNLDYTVDSQGEHATFKIDKPGYYDLVFIANEGNLSQTFKTIKTRRAMDQYTNRVSYKDPELSDYPASTIPSPVSGNRMKSPMTAEYMGVNLTAAGTKDNPYRLTLPTSTGKVELLRALAKVEILFKDAIMKRSPVDDNQDKYPYKEYPYEWAWPELVHEFKGILAVSIPQYYSLFPVNKYTSESDRYKTRTTPTTEQEAADNTRFAYFLGPYPRKRYAIPGEDADKDESTGGIRPFDYKIYFYIPECLVAKNTAKWALPLLDFNYDIFAGKNWWDEIYETVHTYRVFRNNNHATDYLKFYCEQHNEQMLEYSENSVFRNSCYRITVRLDKDHTNPKAKPKAIITVE